MSKPDTEDMEMAEYSALRDEKLSRYEYANKLFSDTVNFAVAVLAAVIGAYAFFSVKDDQYQAIIIEYVQIVLLFLPVLFSTMTFHYSIRNSIRIHLISDYLRHKTNKASWEDMKKSTGVHYFSKNPLHSKSTKYRENPRIGDLLPTHMGIAIVCMLIAGVMIWSVTMNCIGPNAVNIYKNQNMNDKVVEAVVYPAESKNVGGIFELFGTKKTALTSYKIKYMCCGEEQEATDIIVNQPVGATVHIIGIYNKEYNLIMEPTEDLTLTSNVEDNVITLEVMRKYWDRKFCIWYLIICGIGIILITLSRLIYYIQNKKIVINSDTVILPEGKGGEGFTAKTLFVNPKNNKKGTIETNADDRLRQKNKNMLVFDNAIRWSVFVGVLFSTFLLMWFSKAFDIIGTTFTGLISGLVLVMPAAYCLILSYIPKFFSKILFTEFTFDVNSKKVEAYFKSASTHNC